MVTNGENIFQKTQNHKKCVGKAQGKGPKLGVPVGTLRVPIGTQP